MPALDEYVLTRSDIDRFWEKVDKNGPVPEANPELGPCWVWTRSLVTGGYGVFSAARGNGRWGMARAHRIAYLMEHGSLPALPTSIDHECLNRSCVRASHLRTDSSKQNNENKSSVGRGASGVRGVNWDAPTGKWRAKVTHHRKCYNVGLFDTVEEAATAAAAKRNELFTHNAQDRSFA